MSLCYLKEDGDSNEYGQYECIFTIFSLTTEWNKVKHPKVGLLYIGLSLDS